MPNLHDAIAGGRFARHQIFSPDRLVAWSHARRFRTALALAREFAGKRIIDYGCGDGTFLALLMMSDAAPATAVGAELLPYHVEDCHERYRDEPRLRFVSIGDLETAEHAGRYDAVFCMEVLEHVVEWEPVFRRLKFLLAPHGRLVVSVPVETGVPLLLKLAVRRVAGWKKIGHYPGNRSYSLRELAASAFAGPAQHLHRPVLDKGDGPYHDHKGFNWMLLRDELKQHFAIEKTVVSPFPWLGPALATQIWFVLRLR